MSAYVATKANILKVIRKVKAQYGPIPFVHLSTDIWTARNHDSYTTLNARFFDLETMEPHNINLAVRQFNVKHNHTAIAAATKAILVEFELASPSEEQVSSVKSTSITENFDADVQDLEDVATGVDIEPDGDDLFD